MELERLEARRLLADPWGASATVMDQDDAAVRFPTINGTGVTVAVMDTGVDYDHPALGGGFGAGHKVKAGWDFVDNDGDPKDTFGHGTNVAGIIAASNFSFNGSQYQGMAPSVELVALRIAAGGETVPNSRIEAALQWVEDNHDLYNISILNFSFGVGRFTSPQTDPDLSDNFARLANLGILVVCPSGNDAGLGINFPAADPNVAAVGSIANSGVIASFTQRGPLLDLLATGDNVGTTVNGGGFGVVTLTSFSSPVVAGAAALLKQVDPTLTNKGILSILRASGSRIDDSEGGTDIAYSRVDLDNAIALAFHRRPRVPSIVGGDGAANDLAFDREGVLHFAYYDTATHTIQYATRNPEGQWSRPEVASPAGIDAGSHLSIAIDPIGRPWIAYYDGTEGDLEVAKFDGRVWKSGAVDSAGTVGQYPSIAFSSDLQPVVAYYKKTTGDLRYASFDGTTWTVQDVDTAGNTGHYASLAVAKNGNIGIAYGNATRGDVKYASLSGATWSTELVDNIDGSAWHSLAFDSLSRPAIAYQDVPRANLKYATRASGSWAVETVVSRGIQGQHTNLWFNNSNLASIVYYSRETRTVSRAFGTPGDWRNKLLQGGGGLYTSLAVTVGGPAVTYGWLDAGSGNLKTADLAG